MTEQTWTVDVDGKKHTVTVDHDWQSRRATIRVDGRMTVKPMSGDESEREVPIGSTPYVIRRLENDTFDLDIPPEVFLNRAASGAPLGKTRSSTRQVPEERGSGRRIAMIAGGVVVLAIVGGLLRFGRQGLQYMRVPWQAYAPADGTFKAKFSAEPEEERDSQNINGEIWTVTTLSSQFKNHYYVVQHVDLRMVITDATAPSVMDSFFRGWISSLGGTPVSKEPTSLTRNPAFNFVVAIPAGAGAGEEKLKVPALMRGVLAMRDKRLFLVWTLAAQSDPFSNDLRQFIDAFELPPPPERKPQLIM